MHGNTGPSEAPTPAGPAYLEHVIEASASMVDATSSVADQVLARLEDPMWLLRKAYALLEKQRGDDDPGVRALNKAYWQIADPEAAP